ncbi:MAG TPA: ATP-binding cassette domain-containing protein [Flavisolibacter sp.]|jgi:putative ABC transport system ATP-binding protein|nr:ATP-binding cassette domain-containing protein [Flavisolibacter sp.]
MLLQLQDLLPTYFEESRKSTSEIWGKNLEFRKGELIKIVAPSGSGKTSLMHFLYGLRKEYSGTIRWNDQLQSTADAETLSVQRTGPVSIVFQDLRLLPEMTVYENINIKRQLAPFHPPEKIQAFAEQLGIGTKLQSLARTCSYGEQQRVAIIRALMQPFDFLLLDEPFSHLDTANAQKAMTLMLEQARQRQAAILFADLERIEFFPYQRIFHL